MEKYYRTESFLRSQVWAIAAAVLVIGFDGPASANLLANPGFETGSFAGWTLGGNTSSEGVASDGTAVGGADNPFPPNFVNVRSGSFAGYALVKDGDDPVERITLTQTISVLPNSNYTVGFWLGNDSSAEFGMFEDDSHTQIFIDGVGLLNGGLIVPTGSTPAYFISVVSSFNSGANSSVSVEFAINGSGTSRVNVSFDDFLVEGPPAAVPEPPTLALLSISLAGLGFSRRRQKVNCANTASCSGLAVL